MPRRTGNISKEICGIVLFLCFGTALLAADLDVNSLPKPAGYLSDLAHVVNPQDAEQLESFCTRVEQELGVQFALVTVDSVGDRPIRDIGLDLFRKWGVGDRKTNQGVLLLLAIKDHKSDIETGRGIEPYLTDGFSGGTLRAIIPDLRASEYGAALMTAARTMAGQIAQGKNIAFSNDAPVPRQRQVTTQRHQGIPAWMIIVGIFFLFWILGRGRRGGGGRGGGGGGLLTGMLLGNLLGGGRGGGGWGGGGFGGDSGGGGGFGGFGGGDAGGGGASSNW